MTQLWPRCRSAASNSPTPLIDQPLHNLRDEYHAMWPAFANVPWFPAMGDGAAQSHRQRLPSAGSVFADGRHHRRDAGVCRRP